jgi:hypothetical protein
MPQQRTRKRSLRGQGSASSRVGKSADLDRFVPLAKGGLGELAKTRDPLAELLRPVDALAERYRPPYEPDQHLVDYAREYSSVHLQASQAVGAAVMDGTLDLAGDYLGSWRDAYASYYQSPQLLAYAADRPGSTIDPALRYKLEWTGLAQPNNAVWDVHAHAQRWRSQEAIASKTDGTCIVTSNTHGDETIVQAGVGALFQPTRRPFFQFSAMALWTSWVSISADAPPAAPPHPIATALSHGAVRLVAQSWRASDRGDFRTDAIRYMPQWTHAVGTRNPERTH